MKKFKSLTAMLLAIAMTAALLSGCAPSISYEQSQAPANENSEPVGTEQSEAPAGGLDYAPGTELRMATGYNSPKTGIAFDAETAGEGVTLADGNTYHTGELKPTWAELEKKLNVTFKDMYQGNSANKEFDFWKERLGDVDMVSGTATKLTENGEAGSLVNIAEYLDLMPNFKAYLDQNPIVHMSIVGNTDTGAIYFSPYFDGVDDIERMPLMRTDWVEKLLNGEGDFTAASSKNIAAPVYQPYMPTSGKVEVDVVKADGSGTEKVTKDYDAGGNIIDTMNKNGAVDGVTAVNLLRHYIDETYSGYYGANRADLFVGQNAAWDADELVALLRCVVANPQTLNGTDTIQGLFSREDNNNQRRVDMFRFAGTLFGVRGLESRQDYLYVGADGEMHDARQDKEAYEAMERMHAMAQEGLISKAFMDMSEESTKTYLQNDLGFMHYDYNQTQTVYNETKLQEGEKYMAVMVPVAHWYDGSNDAGVYMRFTESWRSVKTDAWAISKAGVGSDENKLNAALKLIDYAYSDEGMILMSYGPDAFIKEGETFLFNGKEMPVIADATYEELWEKASGNYTNYARQYLGSTLSFAKSQAFEYQCTHEVGKEGAGYISNAIGLGTIKHPELALAENPWYTSMPTVLPNTTVENDMIKGFTELGNANFGTGKDQANIFVDQIVSGYTVEGVKDAESAAAKVTNDWNGQAFLDLRQQGYDRLVAFYNGL